MFISGSSPTSAAARYASSVPPRSRLAKSLGSPASVLDVNLLHHLNTLLQYISTKTDMIMVIAA